MEGNFRYSNPTHLYFGQKAMESLKKEVEAFGQTVMLCYGGGSIKRNGIYDNVMQVLQAAGKTVVDDGGVMPNPTIEKLREGAAKVRDNKVDLILAVGGGSTVDYAKGVSVSAYCDEDPWQKYYVRQENPSCPIVPVGVVLTMVGTGSEMNGGSVITNHAEGMKIGKVFRDDVFPRFTILNPEFTFTVPQRQMVAGVFDIMSHIMEQYFAGDGDYTTDYIAEGLMRSLIHSSRIAVRDPRNYEARSNIMWTATWALNTLLKCGKGGDWMVHMIGQAIGAHTDATHGMTLSAVSLPYYRFIMHDGLHKFVRFAKVVWDVDPAGKTDEQVANDGLLALEAWMREVGVSMHSAELGVTEQNIPAIADSTFLLPAGYRHLTRDEVINILRQSL
ncbi:MAG: iron-containing alcohol dehydrogenase [Bacteroidales bacterium]|nr:iron-containing alcohol dehydrogenase [Bacteroidales bacterium]MBR1850679.1 iron-containing alcohol dehydrogenase [Bacteroidales bacterium]